MAYRKGERGVKACTKASGERFLLLHRASGLTKIALARLLGVSKSAVYRYHDGCPSTVLAYLGLWNARNPRVETQILAFGSKSAQAEQAEARVKAWGEGREVDVLVKKVVHE